MIFKELQLPQCNFFNEAAFIPFIGTGPTACRNYQEIKIQEQVQRLSMGTIPRSMWVILEDDLVDTCKAGDDVTIWCGFLLFFFPILCG